MPFILTLSSLNPILNIGIEIGACVIISFLFTVVGSSGYILVISWSILAMSYLFAFFTLSKNSSASKSPITNNAIFPGL